MGGGGAPIPSITFMDSHQTQHMQKRFLLPVQQLHILRIWPTTLPRSLFCRLHREICWPGTTGSTISDASHFLLFAFCCWQRVEWKKTVQTTYRKKQSIYRQPKIAANNLMYHSVEGRPLFILYDSNTRHLVWFFFLVFAPFWTLWWYLKQANWELTAQHTALFAYVAHKQYALYSR